jgi:hypothetical protein
MPYAPGIAYRAGDYFASIGPQIAQNIQNYQRNKEEREQSLITAQTLARYIGDDPKAHELFGEQLSQIPSMSAGQAKGVIGGLTMYLNQKRLNSLDEIQRSQLGISQKQLGIQEADAAAKTAERERLANFNRQISQSMNPPLMFKSAAGGQQQPLDADTFMRIAGQAGVLGDPQTTGLFNAMTSYAQRTAGPQLGQTYTLPDGTKIVGVGPGQRPEFIRPEKGMAEGETIDLGNGRKLVGKGPGFAPEIKEPEKAPKPSAAEETFMNVVPAYAQQLDDFEKTVKKFGNFELATAEPRAKLKQLPYQMAISYAKIADPSSVAREGEVQAAQKYLLPSGLWTWNSTTEAAIAAQKEDLVNRVKTWSANNQGKVPANMPLWLRQRLATGTTGEFTSAEEVRKAYQEGKLKWDEAAQILSQKKFSE